MVNLVSGRGHLSLPADASPEQPHYADEESRRLSLRLSSVIDLGRLADDQRELADQINRLRDILDDLLFGARDFGMVGVKP